MALDHNFRAFSLDVLPQLRSREMLALRQIAYVTPKLWTLVLLHVHLQLIDCHPTNLRFPRLATHEASVWELAEFNYIANDWIDLYKEVTLSHAVGTL